jgi:excisionase family DNA binding protein
MQLQLLTVPGAADRAGRDPETIRRWIRAGKLRAQKIGTQHMIEEADLDQIVGDSGSLPIPKAWRKTWTGEPQPDWIRIIRRSRRGR